MKTKICKRCGIEQSTDEFSRKGSWICNTCKKKRIEEYHKKYSQTPEFKERKRLQRKRYIEKYGYSRRKRGRERRREEWIKLLDDKFGLRCSICGYDKSFSALDGHHLDPTKKNPKYPSLGKLLVYAITPERIKELDNIVLVCANCHRELHSEEGMTTENIRELKNPSIDLDLDKSSVKIYDTVGRPSIGERAMTPAERKRRHYQKKKKISIK